VIDDLAQQLFQLADIIRARLEDPDDPVRTMADIEVRIRDIATDVAAGHRDKF
jgi:hypothetical protein